MNSRERIIKTFNKEIPDKVPVTLNTLNTGILRANEGLLHSLLEYTDPNIWVFMDRDFTCFEIIFGKNIYKESKVIKEGNKTVIKVNTPKGKLIQVTENREDSDWVIEYFFKDIYDLEKFYSFYYEPFEEIDINEYIFWDRFTSEQGIASIVIYDAAIMLYLLMGPQKYYLSLIDDFEAVKKFTEEVEFRIEIYVKRLFQTIHHNPIVFLIPGSEAFTKPMTSHYYYDQLIFPYDEKLVKLIQELGGIANIHQHGMVKDSIESFIKMNPSCISPFEVPPAGDMEIKKVKEKLGGKICINGNLDDLQVLTYGAEVGIKIQVLELLRDIAQGGGFMLGGTDSSILTDKMLQNFIMMGKMRDLYGRYPIDNGIINERLNFLKNKIE
jgi:hypothetical protein